MEGTHEEDQIGKQGLYERKRNDNLRPFKNWQFVLNACFDRQPVKSFVRQEVGLACLFIPPYIWNLVSCFASEPENLQTESSL